MNTRIPFVLVVAAVVGAAADPAAARAQEAAVPGPVSAVAVAPVAPAKAKRKSSLITYEEIREANAPTAYEAVSRLRAAWLRKRGVSSLNREGGILVYQDGMRFGGIAALRQMNASQIESISFLDGTQATQRYGTNHGNGVILVTTRH